VQRSSDAGTDTLSPVTDLDRIAAAKASAASRLAHHEAGHAVAAVARGGRVVEISLGSSDWSTADTTADEPGYVVHRTTETNAPFVTFAGPWAEAMWMVEIDGECEDIYEALELAWTNSPDGDGEKYGQRVAELHAAAELIGLHPLGTPWEADWEQELAELWPAVCEIADALLSGETVTDEVVTAALPRGRIAQRDRRIGP